MIPLEFNLLGAVDPCPSWFLPACPLHWIPRMPASSCPGGLADSCGQLFPVAYTADVTKKICVPAGRSHTDKVSFHLGLLFYL